MPFEGLDAFLAASAPRDAFTGPFQIEPIRQEASSRAYHRILFPRSKQSLILCSGLDASGDTWKDFLSVGAQLRDAGISVPAVYGESIEKGWLLLSDLGTLDLGDELRLVETPVRREEILKKTLGVLAQIHTVRAAQPVSSRRFDAQKLKWEIDFMLSKLELASQVLGRRFSVSFEFQMFLYELCDLVGRQADTVFTHRDFHARNILVGPDGAYAVIDFQDARMGLPWYDLASFLYDPYVEWTPAERKMGFQTYCRISGRTPAWGLYLLQALQRVLKALGTYLWITFEKGSLSHAPFIKSSINRAEDILQNGRMPDSAFVFVSEFRRDLQPAIDEMVAQGLSN